MSATPARLPARVPPLAVALIAGAGLGYEVLLLRLFAIAEWHHFAALVISLALLGFGVAGSTLALANDRLTPLARSGFTLAAVGFSVAAPLCWALSQAIPFNALAVLWEPVQAAWLAAEFLVLMPAFFCVAAAITFAFAAEPARSARTYGADLVGAGLGSAAAVGLLFWLPPADCLLIFSAAGLLAAALNAAHPAVRWPLVVMAVVVAGWPSGGLAPAPSSFKPLAKQLDAPGAEIIDRRSSPLGRLDVVASRQIPIRHAPGLSLQSPHSPPPQLALFTDAAGMQPILQPTNGPPAYLDWLTSALPYALVPKPRVLLLGLKGGAAIWQAKVHAPREIMAVAPNRRRLELLAAHGEGVLSGVETHASGLRSAARRGTERYDVVQLVAGAPPHGAGTLRETHHLTVEAYADYLRRLAPGGVLAVSHWIQVPPRATVKSTATAKAALASIGIDHAGQHLALIRGWRTATLVIARQPLRSEDIASVKAFAQERGFDLGYLPGMKDDEANQRNQLTRPYFFDAANALLSDAAASFFNHYPFHVRPARDVRPYFYRFFRWETAATLAAQRDIGGRGQVDLGYPLLLLALAQAAVLAMLLILAPLLPRAGTVRRTPVRRLRLVGLCLAVGFGFLFVEIAFIARFSVILGHPVYATALVLGSFLLFAGAGAMMAQRLADRIWPSVTVIVVLGLGYLVALPWLGPRLGAAPLPLGAIGCLVLTAPLATAMGVPFARALRRLGERDPGMIPWAWGINGVASVIAALAASLVAVHLGFTAVIAIALALYGVAALCYRF